MDWNFLAERLPLFIPALGTTLILFFAILCIGTAIGWVVALGRTFGSRPVRLLLQGYSWMMRAIPGLLLIFFIFYGFPRLGIRLPPMVAAILGVSISSGAYMGETFRSGLRAVKPEQIEAAQALGLG